MSREIRINYEEVYAKAAELRQRITAELREMDAAYRQAQTSLRQMDSQTNAEFIESMRFNQEKAQITAETLTKLLSFIESSARQCEREERDISRMFERSRASIRRERGRA